MNGLKYHWLTQTAFIKRWPSYRVTTIFRSHSTTIERRQYRGLTEVFQSGDRVVGEVECVQLLQVAYVLNPTDQVLVQEPGDIFIQAKHCRTASINIAITSKWKED